MERRPNSILVAVDGSDQALEAVRYVANLVPPKQAKITLFHVLDRIPQSYWDLEAQPGFRHKVIGVHAWEFQQKKLIQGFMERANRLLTVAGHPKDSVLTVLQERQVGIARDIIIEAKKGYDAVVMGRRGMSPVKDLFFGSTANKLVSRLLDVPVWVIGGSPSTEKLLVAVDRSEGAQRALNYVERFLTRDGTCCECLLFHVLRGSHTFVPDDEGLTVPKGEEDWQERAKQEFEKAEEEMKAFFTETIQQWSRNGVDTSRVSSKIFRGESRAGNIVDQAARAGYGTIVVGRRGMSKVEEFFMGRVSNKVLQLAKEMAVWVVH